MTILVAEDDEEDRLLIQQAIQASPTSISVHFVENGEQALDFLLNKGKYIDQVKYARPGILLLDLNMPRMDGRELIEVLKNNPSFVNLPLVVLSTSNDNKDIEETYHLGANSFITKPSSFSGFVDVMKSLKQYWFDIVELPKT